MTSISIITATRNSAATIAGCLASVQSQTVSVEHLIIDGVSTDDTLDIITRLKPDSKRLMYDVFRAPCTAHHSPFTAIISELDAGIYDAMNKGVKLATGEVIGILNSDDVYADDRILERVAAVFEDPTVEACYGDLVYVREADEGRRAKGEGKKREAGTGHWTLGTGKDPREGEAETSLPFTFHPSPFTLVRYWKSGPFDLRKFYWGWMPPHPTFFVRRSVYEKFGLFRLDMGSAADYELMLRFLLKHRITTAYIPEVLVRMRVGGASNESLAARLKANRMDRRAWEVNGLRPYPWTLICKPLRKVVQYFVRR